MIFSLTQGICLNQQEQDTVIAKQYYEKATEFLRGGIYDSSYFYYSKSTDLYKETSDSIGYGKGLYGKGISLHYQRNSKDALPYYFQSLEILSRHLSEVNPFLADLYNGIGGAYIDEGLRMNAREYLKKSLEINMELYGSSDRMVAVNHYNLGLITMYYGEYESSLAHFMKALPIYMAEYGENGARVAQLYTNVGILHRYMGDYDLATDYFNRAIAIHMENHGPNYWNLAYPYANLGEVHELMGENDLAIDYFQKALTISEKDPTMERLESICHAMIGKYYGIKGDFDLGLEHLNSAIEILIAGFHENHAQLNDLYRLKGDIYNRMGEFKLANEWYEKALENVVKSSGMIHPALAEAYQKQSDIYMETGQYDLALAKLQEAINSLSPDFNIDDLGQNPTTDGVLDEHLYLRLIKNKGYAWQLKAKSSVNQMDDLTKSLDQYLFAAEIIDEIRRGYLSEGSKLFLQQNAVPVYERAITVCLELHNLTKDEKYLERAFFFMEKSKSVVLAETLQQADQKQILGVPEIILNREQQIASRIKALEVDLANSQLEENDSAIKSITKTLFHARTSQDSLASIINKDFPNYHQLKYDDNIAQLGDVKNYLKENELMLSYFEGDSTWFVLAASANKIKLKAIDKKNVPSDLLDHYRELLINGSSDVRELSELSYSVYKSFVEDQVKPFEDIEKLIVIPDGIFGYLPFDALVSKPFESPNNSDKPRYLLEDYSIHYANSMTMLQLASKKTVSYKEKYVGFAPQYSDNSIAMNSGSVFRDLLVELSGTEEEVRYAGNLFSGRQFVKERATEHNFKTMEESPVILHLAMHALVDDKDPMRSRLVFTSKSDTLEDGELNAFEIYNLNLGSQLSVLSACNTGYGEINRGEGIMSLSRAFMYAGSPNIVMSLWRAKDQPTTSIICRFFENIKENMPKDEALREAKLSYLKDADPLQAHPANWATFVLLGNSDPVQLTSPYKKWWIAGIISFFLLTSFFYYRYKRNQ